MAISRETVAEVKRRADIVQIIGEKVSLTPSGSNFKGLCPFHSEKTPSFMVNPQRGMYHCFGCGEGGSVVDFLMAHERMSFPEAIGALAQRTGMKIETGGRRPPGERALSVLEDARSYYHDLLMNRPEGEAARMYLRGRSLEEDAWSAFGLGFARDGWQGLVDHLSPKGFSLDDQLQSGLVRKGKSGNPYDMLRKRVVFPIREARGGCIAFGGRAISDQDSPKYLNTPETRLYKKGRVLYGLAEGMEAMRTSHRAVLVEGYLDVIRMHMHGIPEAVATCGTALTADHLEVLERYVRQVVLVFDGDQAGSKAAMRSAPLFFNRGLEARVATLPDGLDPDDFLLRYGQEALAERLSAAVPILEYLVWNTLQTHGNSPAGKERAMRELVPLLAGIRGEAARDMTLRYLADLLGVRADAIARMIRPADKAQGQTPSVAVTADLTSRDVRHQQMALAILMHQPGLTAMAKELLRPEELADADLRRLLERLLSLTDQELEGMNAEQLAERLPDVAPVIRVLVMETPRRFEALRRGAEIPQFESALQYEIAMIKESYKDTLWREAKQATGSEQEQLALRRYFKVRDQLCAMKSVATSRSAIYDGEKAAAEKQRIYGGQVPFPNWRKRTSPEIAAGD
ncbi:MAG: DNA primase [SAR324 cluster bacterium]|nr:DNA primase [SAR324 cluster bacterium]